jgi:signal transduction histidine kinase
VELGLHAALDAAALRALPPLTLALALLFFGLAAGHVLVLPGEAVRILVPAALASAGGLLLLRVVLSVRPPPLRLAQPLMVAVGLLLTANTLLHMQVMREPVQTTVLVLLLIGGALLLPSQRWFSFLLLATVGAWLVVMAGLAGEPEHTHFAFMLMIGAVLAGVVQQVRRRNLLRLELLRLEDETRRRELEEARALLEERVAERTAELREVNELLLREIGEREEAEERLRQAQVTAAVGRLAGGIAHDFNNLLTIISGHTELLREELGEQDPRILDVEEIRRATQRAAVLTRQLLAFGGRQLLRPAVIALNDTVRSALRLLDEETGWSGETELQLTDDLPAVFADPSQLEQVLVQLVKNAREAMPEGGRLTLRTGVADDPGRWDSDPAPTKRSVFLEVEDEGEGMDEATLAQVFDPFFTTRSGAGHVGLGLSFVHGTVRQSGGLTAVESVPGEGTTVSVWLPAHEPTADLAGAGREPTPSRGAAAPILLVEDEPGVRLLASHVLQREGYAVVALASAEEALEWVARDDRPIRLLVTDIVLPALGGRELARRLEEAVGPLPVLFISGYTGEMVLAPEELGLGRAFLQKPFSVESLLLRVGELLE